MRLLIFTQKVDRNDDVLGFMHGWLASFSKVFSQVTVVALGVGEYDLPENVRVYSLGKERGVGRIGYVINFYRTLWRLRGQYDAVLVHMNPEYVVLGGVFWRLMGKRVALWYTHRAVTWRLRLAVAFSHIVFSASASSFNLSTEKLRIVGHGVDTVSFGCPARTWRAPLRIVSIGRITRIKNHNVLIEAAALLKRAGAPFSLSFVGSPATVSDKKYARDLAAMVNESGLAGQVAFSGSVQYVRMRDTYCTSNVVINAVPTGGLDKTVIEAMASGALTLTSNEGFREFLGPYASDLIFKEGDAVDLSNKVRALLVRTDCTDISAFLVRTARERFDMSALIPKLVKGLSSV